MKKIFLTFFLLHCVAAAVMADDTLTVRIKAMRCGECSHKVMLAVRQEQGIKSVVSNLERRTTTVVFDPTQTSADSIKARLVATHRFKPTPYSPADVILRGFGLRMDDMHCRHCADRITARLGQMEGIDSLSPHLDKHYVFIRYDANKTCKDSIRAVLLQMGFTPVNYYSGPKVSFAYYNIPADKATQHSIDEVMLLEAVDDVNVNARRGSMAVTYFNEEITAEQLLEAVRKAGIDATLPAPHQCTEAQ